MEELKTEDKIDYIYEKLISYEKKRKIWLIFRWTFRILIIAYIVYFYFFGFSAMMDNVQKDLKENFKIDTSAWSGFIEAIREKLINNNKNEDF